MGAREQIQKTIEKKRAELAELERLRIAAEGYIEGLEVALKALPKDNVLPNGDVTLRDGGGAAKAREFLQGLGRPAHITEIVTGIGKEPTSRNRVSLASVLASYARQGKVFTRVPDKPNTFGLVTAPHHGPGSVLLEGVASPGEEGREIDFDPNEIEDEGGEADIVT